MTPVAVHRRCSPRAGLLGPRRPPGAHRAIPLAAARPRAGACGGPAGGPRRPPAGGAGGGGSSSSSRGGPRGRGAPAVHPRLAQQGAGAGECQLHVIYITCWTLGVEPWEWRHRSHMHGVAAFHVQLCIHDPTCRGFWPSCSHVACCCCPCSRLGAVLPCDACMRLAACPGAAAPAHTPHLCCPAAACMLCGAALLHPWGVHQRHDCSPATKCDQCSSLTVCMCRPARARAPGCIRHHAIPTPPPTQLRVALAHELLLPARRCAACWTRSAAAATRRQS